MSAPAAIRGAFVDVKTVRTRKTYQLIIEIPIEEADAALAALGGTPNPGSENWVAVARLNVHEKVDARRADVHEKVDKPPRRFSELPPAQQAALKCNDAAFWRFMAEQYDHALPFGDEANRAAAFVRSICDVASRADLNTDPVATERWLTLLRQFDAWMAHA